jgi:hypothetical protein
MRKITLAAVFAIVALTASLMAFGASPGLAGAKSSPRFPGWYNTNATAAQSRANLLEKTLTPAAVTKVIHLRSITAPPATGDCRVRNVAAPVPAGNALYAVTSGEVGKYNPATGKQIWRKAPPTEYGYESLSSSGNTIVAGAFGCGSASEPPSIITAYNATTGALLWQDTGQTFDLEGLNQAAVVGPFVVTAGEDAAGYFTDVVNLSNGKLVWSGGECFSTGAVLPLVVSQQVISYGCDKGGNTAMQAFSLAAGKMAWSLSGWTFQSGDLSGATGKHLYATSPTGTVDSLNPLTGKVQYSLKQAVTVLAVDLSRVYATCGSGGKFVCAYNISTGTLEWQNTTLPSTTALAAEADGVLYLDFGDALNASTGKVIKTIWTKFHGKSATSIAVGDGRIAVVANPLILDLYGLKGS